MHQQTLNILRNNVNAIGVVAQNGQIGMLPRDVINYLIRLVEQDLACEVIDATEVFDDTQEEVIEGNKEEITGEI